MTKVDLRKVRIGIEKDGEMKWYENMRMRASGTKYANPTQNECTVTISGLATAMRDYIITEASIHNSERKPKKIIVEAGRQSTGTFRVYEGDIVSAEPSMPPDVDVVIKAKTKHGQRNNIVSKAGKDIEQVSEVARRVADDLGVTLDFQATDKNISNYCYSGAAIRQVSLLQEAGDYKAFIDDDTLYVKDKKEPLKGKKQVLNKNSGMVGVPKITEQGVSVVYLITGESILGGALEIESDLNKAASGEYIIEQLKFDIATHDDPFFWIAECKKR